MVRARNVCRTAAVTAAIFECIFSSLVMGLTTCISCVAIKMDGATLSGDCLLSLGMVVSNLFFGTMSLLFSQLSNNSRLASMQCYMDFKLSYLMRLVTDINHQQQSWLSPIGWL